MRARHRRGAASARLAAALAIILVVVSAPGMGYAADRLAASPVALLPDPDAGAVVAFGGDVNLGRRQNAVTAEYGPGAALSGVPQLAEADLAIVNLESVVASGGEPAEKGESGPYYFRGRPEMLAVLSSAGIDVVGTANNHSGDYGDTALLEQARLLDGMNLAHAGSGADPAAACAPALRHAGDLRVAFFSVDATMPHFRAAAGDPGTCYLAPADPAGWLAQLQPRIEQARETADIVLVGLHAGPNYDTRPAADEVAMSRALIDAGADAVLGSSAHVLQGIEVYRDRPIIYDAGNLLFDIRDDPTGAAVFSLVVDPGGVRQIRATPIDVGYGAAWTVDGERAREILADLANRSDALGTTLDIENDAGVLELPAPPVRPGPTQPLPPDPPPLPPPDPLREPPPACTAESIPEGARIQPVSAGPLMLVGVTVTPAVITRREMLWVDTYWTISEPVAGNLWLHLEGRPVDPQAMAPWRGDHEPCDWMWPTSRWEPGVIYHDRYGVRPPVDVATAELDIVVGVRMADHRLGPDRVVARISVIVPA